MNFNTPLTSLRNMFRAILRGFNDPADEVRIPLRWMLLLLIFFILLGISFGLSVHRAFMVLDDEHIAAAPERLGMVNRADVRGLVEILEERAQRFSELSHAPLEVEDPSR